MDIRTLSISLAAGLASGLAVYAALLSGGPAVPLIFLSALPIYIAALAWGTHSGVVASISAIVATAVLISPQVAIAMGLTMTIPASIIGHQANLAQADEAGNVEWYPLPLLLFNLSLILSVALIVVGYLLDYAAAEKLPELSLVLKDYFRQYPPPRPMSDEEITEISMSLYQMLPLVFPGLWLIVHTVNLQIGAIICRFSGIMPRPKDNIPATANLPKAALVVLAVSIALSFVLSGGLQYMAMVFAGVFIVAFGLVGLARAHVFAKGTPVGFVFIVVTYVFLMFFYPAILIFTIGGIARCISNSPTPPPSTGNNIT